MIRKLVLLLMIFGLAATVAAGMESSTPSDEQTGNAPVNLPQEIKGPSQPDTGGASGQLAPSRQRIDKLLEQMGASCNCPRCTEARKGPPLQFEGIQ